MKDTYMDLEVQVLTVVPETGIAKSSDPAHDNAYTDFDDLFRR